MAEGKWMVRYETEQTVRHYVQEHRGADGSTWLLSVCNRYSEPEWAWITPSEQRACKICLKGIGSDDFRTKEG